MSFIIEGARDVVTRISRRFFFDEAVFGQDTAADWIEAAVSAYEEEIAAAVAAEIAQAVIDKALPPKQSVHRAPPAPPTQTPPQQNVQPTQPQQVRPGSLAVLRIAVR